MQPLAFTTDKMSWPFILSALRRIQTDEAREPSVALNLEAPACVVLSCVAIEAFVNEVASLTNAFLFEQRRECPGGDAACAQGEEEPVRRVLEKIANIRTDSRGSFYDRYKRLLCDMDIARPNCLVDLASLKRARDALVHFRQCDITIVEDGDGVIREGQEFPSELAQLQALKYRGQQIVAPDQGSPWTLRLATDAMAAWSLELCPDAIGHALDQLPAGRYRDSIWKAYACRDSTFDHLFASGKELLAAWWDGLGDSGDS